MRFTRWVLKLFWVHGAFALVAAGATTAPKASEPPPDLRVAQALAHESKYAEAAAIYERWVKLNPKDAAAWCDLGFYLANAAAANDSAAQQKKLRKRAYEALQTAKKLGSTSAILELTLSGLRPDGTAVVQRFSNHEEAARLMASAEQAFVKGDFDRAYGLYQKTLALEPTNYHAALYSGDVHFNRGNYAEACTWFAKAVAIDPNVETAHRYWADALRKLGRHEESMARIIEAVVADPYNRIPREALAVQARATGQAFRARPLSLPNAAFEIKGEQITLHASPDQSAVVTAYSLVCAAWRSQDFAKEYPAEKVPRHSLREEVAGLEYLLEAARSGNAEDQKAYDPWRPALKTLASIAHDGLLEPFALFERVDAELARDYAAYRAQHREKLVRFIRVYWCGLPPVVAAPAQP